MRLIKLFWVAALLLACASLLSCANKKAAGILYIKALESYRQKDFSTAEAFINQSLKADKKSKQAVYLKAKIHLFQGQYKEALKLFSDLYKSESDNKDIQRYLIQSLIFLEDYESAKKEIQEALKKDKGDWRLYFFAATVAAKEKKADERFESLNLAKSALAPGAQVYFDLAFSWQSLGIDEKAKEYRDKCLCLDSSYQAFFKEEKNESDGKIP
ncbi:MAG: tetratricopeptide repeat protein [Treponema sp.]|nr:tetratricopeptide repeat protein [Treponema sp.]